MVSLSGIAYVPYVVLSPFVAAEDVDDDIEVEVAAHSLDQEGLTGLRARLAFMEIIPAEEEHWVEEWGHGLRATVDALKVQLQVYNRSLSVSYICHLSHCPPQLCTGLAVFVPFDGSHTSGLGFSTFSDGRVADI